jgi:hypothetical protein
MEMTALLGKVMAEVLCILALSTKEIKRGRISESIRPICHSLLIFAETFLNQLAGRKEIENALRRLDKLTQEETRVAVAENLEGTQSLLSLINGTLIPFPHTP